MSYLPSKMKNFYEKAFFISSHTVGDKGMSEVYLTFGTHRDQRKVFLHAAIDMSHNACHFSTTQRRCSKCGNIFIEKKNENVLSTRRVGIKTEKGKQYSKVCPLTLFHIQTNFIWSSRVYMGKVILPASLYCSEALSTLKTKAVKVVEQNSINYGFCKAHTSGVIWPILK